ncbi:hypothetical protein E4U22_008474, partial [Claviceps purpurea]
LRNDRTDLRDDDSTKLRNDSSTGLRGEDDNYHAMNYSRALRVYHMGETTYSTR